jgi:hypothetical protein
MALVITTTSCASKADYFADVANVIYPGFVDGLPYWSFENDTSLATSLKDYFQLRATGGTTYEWVKISGDLPDGLSLGKNSLTDGKIYGKPTKVGTFTFTVQVSSPGETPVTKELTMMVDEWRAKWLRDARTVITNHWGKMSGPNPPINNTTDGITIDTHVDEFEEEVLLAGEFDAEAYAGQFTTWGIDVMELSVKWQNHSLLYPSTYPTRYGDHTTRDFLGEILTAFHADGKKVLTYLAPDSFYYGEPPQILCDGAVGSGNFAGPNDGQIREMIDKGIDGFVFDIGAASELEDFLGVNPGWLNRDAMIAALRKKNPWCIFGINPGIRFQGFRAGGTLIAYPHCDFVIFESVKSSSTSEQLLEWATPPIAEKQLAVYVWQQLTTSFAFGVDTLGAPIKEIEGIKRNMSKNWNAGATFAAALPVKRTGELLDPHFASTFNALGTYHSDNKNFSDDVAFVYASGHVSMSTPSRSKIFYTLDGSEPTNKSQIYMQPIPVSRNTMIRARSLQRGKVLGYIGRFVADGLPTPDDAKVLFKTVPNDVSATDVNDYYKGMLITIGKAPIELLAVGRKVVGAVTQDHKIMLRRKPDEYALLTATLDKDTPAEDGYMFADTAAIRLEAGMSYVICCQEGTVDQYASNTFSAIPGNPDIQIAGIFSLTAMGDFYPVYTYTTGQFLKLKYRVLEDERSENLALGANAAFIHNTTGATLQPSAGVYFANNATNGDMVSAAMAGGSIAYTLRIDLGEPLEVSRVQIIFSEGFATQFELYKSMNGSISALKLLKAVSGNTSREIEIIFGKTTLRYLHLRAIKPSLTGETGGQMQVIQLNAFKR